MTRQTRAAWIWRRARPWLPLAAAVVVYGVLRGVFAHGVGDHGLVTPGRSPERGLAAFALVVLALRVTVLVAVPAVLTYRLVSWLASRWIERRR